MKLPDKDTCTIWYCLIAFGVLTSFCLHQFASVSILHSIWVTIPTFLIAGYVALRWMNRSIDNSIRRANSPIHTSKIPDLGELRQFPERWEIALESTSGLSVDEPITLTIDAPDGGPTDQQFELARKFCQWYADSEEIIRVKLREFFENIGAPEEYETVNLNNMSVYILSPDDETEIEIWYETVPEYSDMCYTVCITDWHVCDIYGSD